MIKRTTDLAAVAILALAAVSAPGAQAAYVMSFQEIGGNVVEVGGGTLDRTDLNGGGVVTNSPSMVPSDAFVDSGDAGANATSYQGLTTTPSNFGSGGVEFASSGSGDAVGISKYFLWVPEFYISGSPLSETSTYLGATFAPKPQFQT